ncbi:MAG TPA: pentapeptide repeat-containing protein [Hyphomicrobiaceae bacterium]|nr:pentapeptide repeat-containing protein [Hyphomicrobiaceae bacterium]
MSDPLHLAKVRAGALVWNKWRRDNPGIVPDLNGLRISASELQFGVVQGGPVDFSRTELAQAVLVHATLIEANLAGALLAKADLSYARLNKADLRGADLRGAKLAYTDLTDARLDGAFVCDADLRHARGLTQQQLDRALGGERTLLPADLEVPATWLAEDERERQRGDRQGIDSLIKAYDLLGVKPKASMQEVRTAWLRLVKELHPDIAADDPSATERLKAVNRAYQGLKNLERQEIARKAQRGASHGAATFVVFLLLPIATTLAITLWTRGLPEALQGGPVAAVSEQGAAGEPPHALVLAPKQAAGEPEITVALRYPPKQPAWSVSEEPGALSSSGPERPDNAAADEAAWKFAADEGTTTSLNGYLERFPQGRHAKRARDDVIQVAAVEEALGDSGARDAAAMERAQPMLRRYLADFPTGQLADEARGKLAALEASTAVQVARSDTAPKDDERKVAEPKALAPAEGASRAVASADIAEREPGEDAIAWSDARHGNPQDETESVAAYLQTKRSGQKTAIARAMIEPERPAKPLTGAGRQVTVTRPVRPSGSVAQSATRWPSADEPFVAADGRIR